ncbi:DUF1801 domain-containing protein [Marivita hallyeonensis]|uniref:YdhG-like domain-containing protein n=1 Tax=Marivita hallyeonensis TaxID=996342 RepID=A0A1M5VQP1_9RHOB|nr:DUF1801 domain-containing protein [Marivita hallyeonensis]SHH77253.1 protein of unknown function (DU1801) [Marivita hallyeonensis]
MSSNVTAMTDASVEAFIDSVTHAGRREDARVLDQLFRDETGFQPRMWGPSIIGYGQYHYVYASGREGDFLATGFSPRKANMSIYIMPGYQDYSELLKDLGPHKTGASCLYVGRLSKIDLDVLRRIVRAGLTDLGKRWPVQPT